MFVEIGEVVVVVVVGGGWSGVEALFVWKKETGLVQIQHVTCFCAAKRLKIPPPPPPNPWGKTRKTGKNKENVFAPIWNDVKDVSTRDIFRNVFKNHNQELRSPEDYVNHSLYFEAKTFLHGLLVVEDKLSMAHSLETRVPFLDNDLVDFAMSCPVGLKLNNLSEVVQMDENEPANKPRKYFQRTNDGKQILRDAMKKYIPDDVTRAEKQGFSAPDGSWFKGESIDFVKQAIFNNNAKIYDYLDKKAVQGLVNEHLSGEQNRRLLIWSLLNVEEYLGRYDDW